MKTLSKSGLMLAFALALFMSSCAGEYYVSNEPVEPVYVRPVAPYAGAIWIDGDWVWSGGSYVYRRGYWARPMAGHVWRRGEWYHTPRGYAWRRGRWR